MIKYEILIISDRMKVIIVLFYLKLDGISSSDGLSDFWIFL